MTKRKQVTKRSIPRTSQGRSVVKQYARQASTRAATQRTSTHSAVSKGNILTRRFRITRKGIVIFLIIIGLVALAFYQKQFIIAATVDNSPVFFPEVLARMNQQYGQQTLNQIINEKIILAEAQKQGAVVSEKDIDERISQLETTFGGAEGLDALLSQNRQTRADLRRELRLQLSMEKLYEKEASVSADEIDKFISENAAQLRATATEAAKQREEATETLRQQKLSKIFSEKFQQLRQQAKITVF